MRTLKCLLYVPVRMPVLQYMLCTVKLALRTVRIIGALEYYILAITELLEVTPNHRILPWLATITWPWHSFLRVFFKIASIGLTQNFHILTHQSITIYWFCQKEEEKKNWFVIVIVTQIFCVKSQCWVSQLLYAN